MTTNTNEITLPWVRIWGPEKTDGGGLGDYVAGDYAWETMYGCGTHRAVVTYSLTFRGEEWGDDEDGSDWAWITCRTETYTIAGLDADGCEVHNEDHDYEYEDIGLSDFPLADSDRAHRELDRYGKSDIAWAFSGLPFDVAQSGADEPSTWAAERTAMEKRLTSHYQNDRVVA